MIWQRTQAPGLGLFHYSRVLSSLAEHVGWCMDYESLVFLIDVCLGLDGSGVAGTALVVQLLFVLMSCCDQISSLT